MIRSAAIISFLWTGAGTLLAATSPMESAWEEVHRLDSGPKEPRLAFPQTPAPLKDRYVAHLAAQEKALLKFLSFFPKDQRSFEARFRLSRVLALRAEVENNPEKQQQASALLTSLEADATQEQKAHIAFTRITQTMRLQRFPTEEQRNALLTTAREFHTNYPTDSRAASLLTEVATRFDSEPKLKKNILEEAALLSRDPRLQLRIKDDLKRTALLGKTLKFSINKIGGGTFRLESLRGNPVILFYFSEESLPSLVAWEALNEGLRSQKNIVRIAISLDKKPNSTQTLLKDYVPNWTVCWDGLGWNSPIAREYGINTVPTAWYVDPQGRVQSLNLLEDLPAQLLSLENSR